MPMINFGSSERPNTGSAMLQLTSVTVPREPATVSVSLVSSTSVMMPRTGPLVVFSSISDMPSRTPLRNVGLLKVTTVPSALVEAPDPVSLLCRGSG